MNAIVTGGCGFIGSHLVEKLLLEGFNVTVIDNMSNGRRKNLESIETNKNLKVVQADINDNIAFLFNDCDYVYHLAALADIVPSINEPGKYFKANVSGTFNVLQCAKNANVRKFLYAASSSCYGIPEKYPTPETSPISPQYPYALTKYLGEELVMHWGQVYKLPVISLRLFNVYGMRSRTNGTYGAVFGVFLAQKLNKKPFTVVGDGTQTRDFTYVTDVANAFYTASQSSLTQKIFNVGSGATVSINRLIELLEGEKTYIQKRPGEPDCTFADVSKINKELKWKASVSFEEGVAKIVQNIDYWKDATVWDEESIKESTKDWFKYLA